MKRIKVTLNVIFVLVAIAMGARICVALVMDNYNIYEMILLSVIALIICIISIVIAMDNI